MPDVRDGPKAVAAVRALQRIETVRAPQQTSPIEPRPQGQQLATKQSLQVLDGDHVERVALENRGRGAGASLGEPQSRAARRELVRGHARAGGLAVCRRQAPGQWLPGVTGYRSASLLPVDERLGAAWLATGPSVGLMRVLARCRWLCVWLAKSTCKARNNERPPLRAGREDAEVLGQRVARWWHERSKPRHKLKRFHDPVGLASARVADSVGHVAVVE